MANSFLTNSLDQAAERLWFQNPVQTLNPESIRPFAFSQVFSRLPIYEDDAGNLPQQTSAASGIPAIYGPKMSMSTNINEAYNFDVQQDNTAFVFNMNNTNNMVEVSYATQDLINNTINIVNQFSNIFASGLTSNVSVVTNVRLTSTDLEYGLRTITVENGMIKQISSSTTYYSVSVVTACP